jgi:hypothetical protein
MDLAFQAFRAEQLELGIDPFSRMGLSPSHLTCMLNERIITKSRLQAAPGRKCDLA